MKNLKLYSFRTVAVMIWASMAGGLIGGNQNGQALAQQQTLAPQEETKAEQEKSDRENRQLKLLRIHLGDLQSSMRSVRERMKTNDHAEIVEHVKGMYELVRQMRLVTIDIPGAKGELLLRDLTDIHHATDELKDSASKKDHKDSDHAMEAVEKGLAQLERDLLKWAPTN